MQSSFAKLRWGAGVCAALLLAGSWAGLHTISAAQVQHEVPNLQQPPPFGEPPNANDPLQHQRLEKLEKARNSDRQKELVADTDKLLSLAKELKEEVSKSNKDTLSVDVVKKAAEIEKLAKNVKDRMRG
jgi:type VI protein secretion system component VasF